MCSSRRSAPTTRRPDHSAGARHRIRRRRQLLLPPKTWPADREERACIIGEWLQPKRDSWPRDRIPPPWDIEEANATCFIVKDNGQALAYVYFEQEPGRRTAANLLTRDEARRIAANIAKLPELVKRRPLKKGAADSPFRWNSFEPYSTI